MNNNFSMKLSCQFKILLTNFRFRNLKIQERQKYTSIQNETLVELLILFSNKFEEDYFKISIEFNPRNQITSQNKFRTRNINIPFVKQKKESEKVLIKNCRILCWRNSRIFLLRQFLSNQIQFFQHLQNISNSQIFEYGTRQLKKQEVLDNPLWFSSCSFNSVGQWICCWMEKNLIKNYYKDKKQNINTMNYGLNNQIQMINYYQKLNEKMKKQFWNGVFQMSKKQTSMSLKEFIEYEPSKITLEKLNCIKNKMIYLQQIYQENNLIHKSEKTNLKKTKIIKNNKKSKIIKEINKPNQQEINFLLQNSQNNSTVLYLKKHQINNLQPITEKHIQQISQIIAIDPVQQQCLDIKVLDNQIQSRQNQLLIQVSKSLIQQSFQKNHSQKINQLIQSTKQQSTQEVLIILNQSQKQINQNCQLSQQISQSPINDKYIINTNQNICTQKVKAIQDLNEIQQEICQSQSKNDNDNLIHENNKQIHEIIESHSTSDSVQENSKKNKKKPKKRKKFTDQFLQCLFEQLLETNLQKLVDDLSDQSNRLLNARILTFERIRNFIMKIYGEYTVDAKLFGSNAVGLALPTSDIDIFLTGFSLQTQQQSIQCLDKISGQLKKMNWIVKCETFLKAKIPIIKLEINPNIRFLDIDDKQNELEIIKNMKQKLDLDQPINQIIKVDITIQAKRADYSHLGIMSTDFMKNWLNSYPALHPIVLTLKYILSIKGLNKPFKGGLSSYCLFIMSAAYLKQFYALNKEEKNIGVIFLKLLQFYSEDFDNESTAISLFLNQNSFYIHQLQKCSLTIIDPLNGRIMTGNCYKFWEIKQEFIRIKNCLMQYKQIINKDLNDLNAIQIKGLLQKRKLSDKWLKRYQKLQEIQLQNIINN